jgi:hypothetical protein
MSMLVTTKNALATYMLCSLLAYRDTFQNGCRYTWLRFSISEGWWQLQQTYIYYIRILCHSSVLVHNYKGRNSSAVDCRVTPSLHADPGTHRAHASVTAVDCRRSQSKKYIWRALPVGRLGEVEGSTRLTWVCIVMQYLQRNFSAKSLMYP